MRDYAIRFHSAADIGCGTGSFLEYLRRFRMPLIGVDSAPQMLRIAARRLQGHGVLLLRQEITRLRLPSPVDLITCNGDTLNYLLRTDHLARALRCCRENLRPGGHFLCDLLTGVPDPRWNVSPTRRIHVPGVVTIWSSSTDPRQRLTRVIIRLRCRTRHGWRRSRESHLQRWHRIPEFIDLAEEAGLRVRGLARLDPPTVSGSSGAWIKCVAIRDEDD